MPVIDDYPPPPCEHRPDRLVACSDCIEHMERVAVRIKVTDLRVGRAPLQTETGRYRDRVELEREQTPVMVAYAAEQGWKPVGPAHHRWLDMREMWDRYEVRDWLDNPDDPHEVPRFDYVLDSQQWCRT